MPGPRDDVQAARQEAGAELIPGRKAGGESAESLGALLFEDCHQPLQDLAGGLPATGEVLLAEHGRRLGRGFLPSWASNC
jgi:hypothetical protein